MTHFEKLSFSSGGKPLIPLILEGKFGGDFRNSSNQNYRPRSKTMQTYFSLPQEIRKSNVEGWTTQNVASVCTNVNWLALNSKSRESSWKCICHHDISCQFLEASKMITNHYWGFYVENNLHFQSGSMNLMFMNLMVL